MNRFKHRKGISVLLHVSTTTGVLPGHGLTHAHRIPGPHLAGGKHVLSALGSLGGTRVSRLHRHAQQLRGSLTLKLLPLSREVEPQLPDIG